MRTLRYSMLLLRSLSCKWSNRSFRLAVALEASAHTAMQQESFSQAPSRASQPQARPPLTRAWPSCSRSAARWCKERCPVTMWAVSGHSGQAGHTCRRVSHQTCVSLTLLPLLCYGLSTPTGIGRCGASPALCHAQGQQLRPLRDALLLQMSSTRSRC